jgi:hypothetical protein
MTSWTIPAFVSTWINRIAWFLDARVQPMLALVYMGLLSTNERRRTVTSWFRAGGIDKEFRRGYRAIGSVGRAASMIAGNVLADLQRSAVLADAARLVFALDDTPTARYGPHVEGAGLHHNPTPGPSGAPFVYGHSWVVLAQVVSHPLHGKIALPLRSELYVREKDVARIPKERGWQFRTKIQQAVELIEWLRSRLNHLDKPIWLVVDGAYAKGPVLAAALANNVILVSRLRKDAALRSLPPAKRSSGQRGRTPKYGKEVISLAKRAGHKQGWQTEEVMQCGEMKTKTFKTFEATWQPAGGAIRVVLVKEAKAWLPFFCTAVNATPRDVLEMMADRNTIEQLFKDVKEVWGAGQQQLTNIHANIGAWHMNLWAYTLVELWAWEEPEEKLVDRTASPWDKEPRRPSHADRRKSLLRRCLREEYQAALRGPGQKRKLKNLAKRLLKLAA